MRNRVIILICVGFFAALFILFFLQGTMPMKEISEWAKSMSPIIAWLTAVFIALSGWAYHHYESDNPKKPYWLSDNSNFTIISMVIIGLVLIAYTIYNNSG